MRRTYFQAALALLLLMGASACVAQDRRTVREPQIPGSCVRLTAALHRVKGDLAPEAEAKLDTARIQKALDGCGPGKAVELVLSGGSDAFLSGPLSLPAGTTLLVDTGVTLFASRDPRLYDRTPGSCGVVNQEPAGCRPLISIDHAAQAAVMGGGVIDGRGGAPLLGSSVTWWQLAEQARKGGRQQVPRILVADHADDLTVYRITLRNSPNFHLVYTNGRGLTVWGVRIEAPRHARNTDGIDPGSASDITIIHSTISTGDDQVAIKGSGSGVQHMSVIANHFYAGHGMSIGSETFAGVKDILIRDLTIDGADNGLRIKSNGHHGGLVQNIRYENVCIRNTKNPVVLDTRYENSDGGDMRLPLFRDIVLQDVRIFGGGMLTVDGIDALHATGVQFDNVSLDQPGAYKYFAAFAKISYGPGPVDFRFSGEGVTSTLIPAQAPGKKMECTFPPYSSSSSGPDDLP